MKNFYKLLFILIICCTTTTVYLQTLSPQKWEAVKQTISKLFVSDKKEIPNRKIDIVKERSKDTHADLQKAQTHKILSTTSPTAVTIAATMSVAVTTDNAPTGASATDVLEYTSVVSNSGSTDATGVTFTNTIDASTTLVAGSITATPITVNDSYPCVGNIGLAVSTASGVLANDVSPTNTPKTVTIASGATTNGNYSINADGSFTYTPNAGYTGADNFSYTLNTGSLTAIGTVNITVSGMIWFVNATAATSGTGTLTSPFKAVSNITGTSAGHSIFFYTGTYTGTFAPLNTQKLIGQGAIASLATITGLSFTNAPASLPSTGGTNPTWNTAALTIASGNDIEGINFNSTTGTTITGASVGALKVRDVSVSNTAGQAVQITAGGALDVQFKSVSAAGAAKGISVNSSTGKFEVLGIGTTAGSGGTINNITNRGAEFNSCTNILLKNMNFTNANTTAAASSATDYSTANGAITLNNVNTITLTKIAISGTTRERGITGKTISNFTLNGGSTITDCGDNVNEGCLYLQELTGTCNITDATLSKGSENIARVFNSTGALTLNIGTDFTTTIFNDTQTQNANMASPGTLSALRSYCFIYTTSGTSTATATLNVRNTSFLKAGTHGFKVISDGTGTVNANVKSCTFNNDNATFSPNDQGGSIEMTSFNTANMNYNILNNSCRGKGISLINIVAQINSNTQGRINDNTVVISGTGNAGEGIRLSAEGSSDITTEVLRNNVSGMGSGVGILATATGGDGKMNATITNNTVTITDALASHNIQFQAGNSSSTFSNTTCANVANNITTRPDLVNGFNYRVRAVTTGTHKLYLQGNGATGAIDVWANNGNTPTGAVVAQAGIYGTQIFSNTNAGALATCAVVSNPTYSIIQPTSNTNELAKNLTKQPKKIEDNSTTDEPTINDFSANLSLLTQLRNGSAKETLSGETVTVNGAGSGFTLPANKSTIIKFRVTVNAAPTSCALSTQATISGSNFSNVLSDDPAVVGTANPTNTTLTVAGTTARAVSASSVCAGSSVTLTATAPNGGTPTWYTASSGGTSIGTGNSLSVVVNANTSYYVSSAVGSCESTRTFAGSVTATPLTLPTTALVVTQNVSNNIFNNTSCALIANVLPNGASPVAGNVTAKVWIEATQPTQFVKRHYEINPATNAANATARITLYFTDAEFNAFNTQTTPPALLLPISTDAPATITARKANLRMEKRAGTGDVNGTLSSYTGTVTTIDPVDADIIWNATSTRWEVSFDVLGFSGFWVKTQTAVLPLNLLSFTGTKNNNGNLLEWKTTNEINTKSFTIKRSNDGINFIGIGNVYALGNGNGNYNFTDVDKYDGVVYYRLKMIDVDGRFTNSNIIKLSTLNLQLSTIYPNPIKDKATLQIGDRTLLNTQATIIDANGKIIKTIFIKNNFEIVDMSGLPSGLYILKMSNGEMLKMIKQ